MHAPGGYAFVSYSHDDQPFALRLGRDLRAANIQIWMDELDIRPGENWDRAVEQALKGATHVLFVASQTSTVSENVLDELSWALQNNKQIIPLMIAPVAMPLRINRLHYIDFTRNYGEGFEHLVRWLGPAASRTQHFEELLGHRQPQPPPPAPPQQPLPIPHAPPGAAWPAHPANPPNKPNQQALWIVFAVIVGVGGLVAIVVIAIIVGIASNQRLPAGAAVSACVCAGPFFPGVVGVNAQCASGYAAPRACAGVCPNGTPSELACQ